MLPYLLLEGMPSRVSSSLDGVLTGAHKGGVEELGVAIPTSFPLGLKFPSMKWR